MTVHDILHALDLVEEDVGDRRNSNRVSFDTTLGVAFFNGQDIPSPDQFIQVHGSDFSHTGISFTTPQWPPSDQVILRLGSLAKTEYAAARIVGCVSQRKTGDETARLEVRCEFERWL